MADHPEDPGVKRLVRVRDGRVLGGVCAGFARYFDVDVTLIRLVALILLVLGVGSPILVYLLCWLFIPLED